MAQIFVGILPKVAQVHFSIHKHRLFPRAQAVGIVEEPDLARRSGCVHVHPRGQRTGDGGTVDAQHRVVEAVGVGSVQRIHAQDAVGNAECITGIGAATLMLEHDAVLDGGMRIKDFSPDICIRITGRCSVFCPRFRRVCARFRRICPRFNNMDAYQHKFRYGSKICARFVGFVLVLCSAGYFSGIGIRKGKMAMCSKGP